jgi:hypothetical protein
VKPTVVKLVGQVAGGREHIVAQASHGDPVLLVPEPTNEYDPNAVAVFTMPRTALEHPEVLHSSLRDPAGVGIIHDDDRRTMMDRQAGYLPRDFAVRLSLPPEGVVGFVSEIRHAPTEVVYDRNGRESIAPPRVAGFDITALLDLAPPVRRSRR